MASFTETFRSLVVPSLRERARDAGFCLANDRWDFDQAAGFVMTHAFGRGAARLANQDLIALIDWTDAQVLTWWSRFETDPEARRVYLEDRVP